MKYLVKNKTYLKFIFLFLFGVLFLLPGKVHALVWKGTENTAFVSGTGTFTGTLNSNSAITLTSEFVSEIDTTGYDYLVFPMYEFNFEKVSSIQIDNPALSSESSYSFTCSNSSNGVCLNATIVPNYPLSIPSDLGGTLSEGDISFSAQIWSGPVGNNTNGMATLCYFNNNENQIYCPVSTMPNVKKISLFMVSKGYDYINYKITYYRLKQKYNNDSTEIVNALSGVQTQQQNTISAIQQQTQQQAQQNAYVQDTSTTQAQTSTTNNITVLNDELTQNLSQFSDLTQLVVAPITMFMELNNNVCAPLTLQIPFVNQTAVLPCIKPIMTQYFGGMYSVFTTVIGAILCYWTFVRTVALIKDLVDADNDKIEVVDL